MREATKQLRASVQKQQKETDALIQSTKGIQKELRSALSSTEAALKEGELLQKKLKEQQPKGEKDTKETVSDRDKERIAKLLGFIEKQAGPKPDTETFINSLEQDGIIESISKTTKALEKKKDPNFVSSSPNPSQKKGHIAL